MLGAVCPTEVNRVDSGYGPRRNDDGSPGFHYGIDLGAYLGNPIVNPLPGPGIVVKTDDESSTGTGLATNIDHPELGLQTRYFHQSAFAVKRGDVVVQGQVIGYVGTSGGVAQHLHFEARSLPTLSPMDPRDLQLQPWWAPGVPLPPAVAIAPPPLVTEGDPLMDAFMYGNALNTVFVDAFGCMVQKAHAPGLPDADSNGWVSRLLSKHCKPGADVAVQNGYQDNLHFFAPHRDGVHQVHVTWVVGTKEYVEQVH